MSDNNKLVIKDENVLADLQKAQPGISQRATSIAKIIDRLPPGSYSIELTKPQVSQARWELCAWKREKVSQHNLTTKLK